MRLARMLGRRIARVQDVAEAEVEMETGFGR